MNNMNNNKSEVLFLQVRISMWINLFLVVAILFIYWQTRTFSYINYDDPEYVFANERVQQGLTLENLKWAFTTIYFSNWHPLTWVSHMIDSQMYGNNPGQHHFTNVLLHIINTLLLFMLFKKMTGDIPPSALMAGLFALHPLHIQSVAWISERKDLLSALFFFLTIFSYLKYLEKSKLSQYFLTLFLFVLGLMAKPMIVTLPFVLLLLDIWPLQRLRFNNIFQTSLSSVVSITSSRNAKIFLEKVPFLALSVVSSIITLYAQKAGGSVAALHQLPFMARGENAIVSYLLYICKMLWPFHLSIIYPYSSANPLWLILCAILTLLVLSVCSLYFFNKAPFFLVGWLWFLGTLVPVIGIIQVGIQAMADRYTYLPAIGLFIAFSWGFYRVSLAGNSRLLYFSVLGVFILLILSLVTRQELQYWKDGIRLFSRAIAVTNNNYIAHNNLGYELVQVFKFEEAKKEFETSVTIDPSFYIAHLNLGRSHIEEGNIPEGIEQYQTAIKLKPDYAEAHNNLGNVLLGIGKSHEAAAHYIQALRINPSLIEAYNNLGAILVNDGKFDQAIALFQKALALNPNFLEAKKNLEDTIWEKKNQEIRK
jgi:protein O-mannosyl-transferase